MNGDAVISADKIDVKGNLAGGTITSDVVQAGGTLNATELKVSDVLDVANGKEQSGTIGTLIFGESGKTAIYAFDVGMDKFTITNSTRL